MLVNKSKIFKIPNFVVLKLFRWKWASSSDMVRISGQNLFSFQQKLTSYESLLVLILAVVDSKRYNSFKIRSSKSLEKCPTVQNVFKLKFFILIPLGIVTYVTIQQFKTICGCPDHGKLEKVLVFESVSGGHF